MYVSQLRPLSRFAAFVLTCSSAIVCFSQYAHSKPNFFVLYDHPVATSLTTTAQDRISILKIESQVLSSLPPSVRAQAKTLWLAMMVPENPQSRFRALAPTRSRLPQLMTAIKLPILVLEDLRIGRLQPSKSPISPRRVRA